MNYAVSWWERSHGSPADPEAVQRRVLEVFEPWKQSARGSRHDAIKWKRLGLTWPRSAGAGRRDGGPNPRFHRLVRITQETSLMIREWRGATARRSAKQSAAPEGRTP